MIQFEDHMFQMGWNYQPDSIFPNEHNQSIFLKHL